MEYLDELAELTPAEQAEAMRAVPERFMRFWQEYLPEWAHQGQRPPEDGAWRTWVIMGGRGFGKTRAGAEWVLEQVRAHPRPDAMRVALVGATVDEAARVMVDGPSGLIALARAGEVERWSRGERRLRFANGAECALFSGRSPQGLRGPEHDLAWCDELGKWAKAGETWDMLRLGLRRGDRPRAVVTTTPSPDPALLRVVDAADTVVTGGGTRANRHLAPGFAEAVERQFAGTRLGVQEVDGVLVRERAGSLWPLALLEASRRSDAACGGAPSTAFGGPPPPAAHGEEMVRIVIGVDPPASAAGTCGIVVAGLDAHGRGWVLADASVAQRSPEGWARAVAEAAAAWGADRVVAEANQGGDMVRSVLRGAARTLPLELVRASRGKHARAEPVAALFESGQAGLAGRFPELEAELGWFTAGGWTGEGSPDRADAMVWALWALLLKARAEPGVRLLG